MKQFFKLTSCVLLILLGAIEAYAQPRIIGGSVKDSYDNILPGAVIQNLNTGDYAVVDEKGNFSIGAEASQTLKVSFIGCNDLEIIVSDAKHYDLVLSMSADNVLDETVVVGFTTQKRVNLTGSVSTVESEQLQDRPVANAVLALQGQVPGLTIKQTSGQLYGRNPAVTLRGQATIGEGSSGNVLVLIDGMEGDLYSINSQDIENISVLKDASASSIYGSRAPFGVILITTKKGEQGKAKINYNNNFRFSSPLNMPSSADSYSWALYFNEAAHNDGNGDDISPARLQRIKDYIDGKISYNTIPVGNQWGTAYTEGNDNIDYYDVFYRDVTFSQDHNISVSGGTNRVNYYASANYMEQNGLLNWDLDGLKRTNVFGKFEAKPYDFLTVAYSSRFILENYHEPTVMNDEIFQYFGQYLWPVAPLYDPNGILFNDVVLRFRQGGQRTISNTTSTQQFNVTLEPIKGWKIIGDINYRYRSYFNKIVDKVVWQTCTDGVSKGSEWDYHTGVANDDGRNQMLETNIYTEYEKNIKGHYFKLMGGFQSESYKVNNTYVRKEGLIVPDMTTIDTTSGLFNGEPVVPSVGGGENEWRTAGFFGRINYNYKEKYLVELNARYDGSSRFRADNRWGFFPSVSLGYNIAKEEYFSSLTPYISSLKLRAAYGSLGNQNTHSYYPTYESIGFANSKGPWLINGSKPNIAWPASLISRTLTWETIKSYNLGFDFIALDNRLSGAFDYFIRDTENMIGPADELPVILGTAVPKTNNTDLRSKGFELELSWKDRIGDFYYGARFVLSDAVTTITKYSNPSKSLNNYYTGKTLGEIWGYETVGMAKTDDEMLEHLISLPSGGQNALGTNWQAGDIMYKDLNEDGKIDSGAYTTEDHGDLKVIGNTTPRFNYGLDLTAEFKGIDFRIFLQGVAKRDYFEQSKYFFGSRGWSKWGTMVLDQHLDYFRDNEDNPLGKNTDSYYPRPYLDSGKNVNVQTRYLQNAAYLRVKNLQLGYTLPKAWTSKININAVRVYFSGENLFTFTTMTDLFDPETIGENEQGNVYPLTRTYSFGVSVTF